jgi:hypothetical protein
MYHYIIIIIIIIIWLIWIISNILDSIVPYHKQQQLWSPLSENLGKPHAIVIRFLGLFLRLPKW